MKCVYVCLILLGFASVVNTYLDSVDNQVTDTHIEFMQGEIGAFQATMSYELSKIDRTRQAQVYGERLLCVTETQAEENARMRETIVKAQKIVADLLAERDTLTKALEHSAKTLDTQLDKNNDLVEELERWERLGKYIPDFFKAILLGK